jgi:hypothetical protein
VSHPWIDERDAPLYFADVADCTEAEAEAFYRAVEVVLENVDHDIAWVLDTSKVTRVSLCTRLSIDRTGCMT